MSPGSRQFTLNPTSCDPIAVTGGDLGLRPRARRSRDRFQVGGCDALGFKPKLALSLKGGDQARAAYPALKATLTARAGDANIGKAMVTPAELGVPRQAHISTVCTRVQFAAIACPASSVYG